MSDQLLSPQHTRRGAQFGAAAADSVSSAATATSQGRGRGVGASRLRAASSSNRGGRGLSAAAAGFSPAPVDEQNHATIVDGGSPRNDAHADDTQVACSPGTRADDSFGDSSTAAAAGATSSQQDVPAVGDQALPAAQATGVEAFALPAHLRSALAAVQDKPAEVRAAVLEALLIAEAAKPAETSAASGEQLSRSSGSSNNRSNSNSDRNDSNSSPPIPTISKLTQPVQDCVDQAVQDSLSARRSLAHAKRLEEGWTAAFTASKALHDSDGVWKLSDPEGSDDKDSVRIPKPLSNLMKGGGVGFKLTGADKFVQSERGVELQKLIDDEYREVAVKVLGHVRDFKTYEREQLESTLSNSEASLKAQVKELYETTEVSAAVRNAELCGHDR